MNSSAVKIPHIPAEAPLERSAVEHAHRLGINVAELDAMAQVVVRLARNESTIAPMVLQDDLRALQLQGYVDLEPTNHNTLAVTRCGPPGLLSAYFWSVWVPHHLLDRSIKVTVLPNLDTQSEVQHCTVVFRIPGPRDATRQFLSDISSLFPADAPEIVAVQAGNALAKEVSK